ncbi:MAG: hypothetical protein WCL50_01970 [Spirochaetota bacterium]
METARDRLARLLDQLSAWDIGRRCAESDGLHRAALDYAKVERLPVIFSWPQSEEQAFPPLPNDAIYGDPAAMLYNELVSAWDLSVVARGAAGAGIGDDLPATIRPNWGTVLVASLLGGRAEQSGQNTPWIRRDDDAPIALEAIAEADPEVAGSGWIPRVIATYEAYRQLLAPYPGLWSALRVTLPDLQGPLDIVEQLTGADLFIDMIERPELAARAFDRAAELQIACARLFAPFTKDGPEGFSHQHGFMVKGKVLIRCDSAVMISPELYRDLVAPADEAVLAALGGGGLHSCGRIGHALPQMLALPSIRCFDFGQSFMNEVDLLYQQARGRRIPFLRVQPTRDELRSASILERFPTGVSLHCPVGSMEEARDTFDLYLSSSARTGRG